MGAPLTDDGATLASIGAAASPGTGVVVTAVHGFAVTARE